MDRGKVEVPNTCKGDPRSTGFVYIVETRKEGEEFTKKLLWLLAKSSYRGGSIGLMGAVSCAVRSGEGHVIGVIPKPLAGKEITGDAIGEVRVVNGMHQRKAEMSRLSDAFITLPGGFGTMEEFFQVITWAQLGIHKKPIGLLNVGEFYDLLLHFIDLAVAEGFISAEARNLILSAPTVHGLLLKLEEYEPNYDVGLL